MMGRSSVDAAGQPECAACAGQRDVGEAFVAGEVVRGGSWAAKDEDLAHLQSTALGRDSIVE
jgi:hypothetical protein